MAEEAKEVITAGWTHWKAHEAYAKLWTDLKVTTAEALTWEQQVKLRRQLTALGRERSIAEKN